MTGIVGFVDAEPANPAGQLLSRMLAAVCDHEKYHVDAYCEEGLGLGRVHLGILDQAPQPLWNEDRSLCLVFEGELYGYAPLKAQLQAGGHKLQTGSGAEVALHWLEEMGEAGLTAFNGAFMLALWNKRERTLLLAGDRLGQRPLYYANYAGRFAFACGVRGLLADPALPHAVDLVAVRQALTYEYVLEDATYLRAARLLPAGCALQVVDGKPTLHRYWALEYPQQYAYREREEHLARLVEHMRQAVARQLPDGAAAGVSLSGGLDSRMMLGLLAEQCGPQNLRAYTFGIPGCDDIRIAEQLAAAAGVAHKVLPLPPDYLIRLAAVGVRLTDGMESCVHMHALARLDGEADEVGVMYTGYLMDSLISPDADREWVAHYDDASALRILHADIRQLFKQAPQEEIFTDRFLHATDEGLHASFARVAEETRCYLLSDWQNCMELTQRQRRFTRYGNDLLRWQVECRTPYADADLVDVCLGLPPALRLDRFVFREALVEHFHKLAKAPLDRTGLPLVNDMRYWQIQLNRHVRWHLHNRGIGQAPVHRYQVYARYDLWMRQELRTWVESILLDERALERGICTPAGLRLLVGKHMDGSADFSRELGMLLSIELWHRMYVD